MPSLPLHSNYHLSVLPQEVLALGTPKKGETWVDATLGAGGHTRLLLEQGARVYGIDRDDEALCFAQKKLEDFGEKFTPLKGNFADIGALLSQQGIKKVNGILADIGVSSHQIDTPERGFSFQKEGPLDMRMDHTESLTAADIVNTYSAEELATLFFDYGEERQSRRLAKAICLRREQAPFLSTKELAHCITQSLPPSCQHKKIHPATRVFQALRIAVNGELKALEKLLSSAPLLLYPQGRFLVITFHSLEDRMVKRNFRDFSTAEFDAAHWPAPQANPNYYYKLLTRKVCIASPQESRTNPRARSAKLRAVVRL